jgi:hypothetical protein
VGRARSTYEKRNAYRILMENPEGKEPLGRQRCRWDDNIKINRRKIGWGGMACIHLTEDMDQWTALVNTVINFRVPQNVGKFLRLEGSREGLKLHGDYQLSIY